MCWYNSIILYDIHDIDIWYWYWLLDLQVEEMYRGEFDIGAEKKLSLNIEDTRYVLMIIVVVVQRWSSWQLFWDSCSWIRLSCGCGSAHCVQKLFQWKEQNKCSDDLFPVAHLPGTSQPWLRCPSPPRMLCFLFSHM